jgi:hypothetical protein
MSRAWRGTARALAASLVLVALAACPAAEKERPEAASERAAAAGPATPAITSAERLEARSTALLAAIRDRDVAAIARFIHPTKGVRLSPYAFVEMEDDQVLTASELVTAWHSDVSRLWGVEDGTGDPLTMTCADYFARFVYDADFMQAEQIAVGSTIGRGNTIDNSGAVYPAGTVVEYHFSGFDPKYEGLDWKSLRLVFEEFEGELYVVGIIHDGWTI